jgi:UDP:flavonoid glycosyltransferase YjiC (YdhE family)
VPFEHLLPLVDVMVTNGGFGGAQQALAGRTEDKAEVGARVLWSGAGVTVPTDRVTDAATAVDVRDAVRTMLAETAYRDRGQELRAEYARYDGEARLAQLVTGLAVAHERVSAVAVP